MKVKKTLTQKFNDAYADLGIRIKTRESIVQIERMYGYMLGIASAMDAVNDPNYWPARRICNCFVSNGGLPRNTWEKAYSDAPRALETIKPTSDELCCKLCNDIVDMCKMREHASKHKADAFDMPVGNLMNLYKAN